MADQVRASHILLMYAGSERSTATRSQDEALEQIKQIQTQLQGGSEFADLARDNSDCPSGREGGDLGWFGPGMMVLEFDQATFGMEVGAVSDVITTPFGYHLIHRTG